ncbi:hypothetical protein F4703DRAFT_1789787 [Phycomyces blakesleeanus]
MLILPSSFTREFAGETTRLHLVLHNPSLSILIKFNKQTKHSGGLAFTEIERTPIPEPERVIPNVSYIYLRTKRAKTTDAASTSNHFESNAAYRRDLDGHFEHGTYEVNGSKQRTLYNK